MASSPDRICISVNKGNFTAEMLQYTKDFTVSIISQDATFGLFKTFGFCSGKEMDRFKGYEQCIRVSNGTLAVTEGTNGFISAHVEETVDLGSHYLFVATITEKGNFSSTPSTTYGYYHANIKPKPQPKKEETAKKKYVCKICGYEYEGEELPSDFVCPICKHGVSDFEKVTNN